MVMQVARKIIPELSPPSLAQWHNEAMKLVDEAYHEVKASGMPADDRQSKTFLAKPHLLPPCVSSRIRVLHLRLFRVRMQYQPHLFRLSSSIGWAGGLQLGMVMWIMSVISSMMTRDTIASRALSRPDRTPHFHQQVVYS